VLQSGIESRRRAGDGDYRLDRFQRTDNAAAVVFSWTTRDGGRTSWAQALTLREGRIVQIQDFADPEKALKAIRR
jgi:ketosteroid isomerase-like protein